MAGVAGFDCFSFPGMAQMAWLKANTNLKWVGYYLAPTSGPIVDLDSALFHDPSAP